MMARLFSQARQKFLIAGALAVLFSSAQFARAQTFNSGSNGSDGALNLTTPGIIEFDPEALEIDADGDHIFHFTTITIASGVTVRLTARKINGPVFWLASGAVQIAGTIDLNGEDGYKREDVIITPSVRRPSIPGTGGYPGGVGALSTATPQPGSGPGGGGNLNASGGGAGHVTVGNNNNPPFGQPYGNDFLVPLIGGSGGGGGGRFSDLIGSGGGAGGGALLIASSVSISVNGTIAANGGNGSAHPGNAGGGSGGAIRLAAPTISGTGTITALGGGGLPGSHGRIRLEAFQQNFTGTSNAAVIARATPFAPFVPTNQPSVRVVSIDGQLVPVNPTGSFTVPDVAINKATAATVQIEARNIPPGTVVKVHFISETGQDQTVDSAPLAGTLAQSTATASVVLPSGFSRGFVRATWTNQ